MGAMLGITKNQTRFLPLRHSQPEDTAKYKGQKVGKDIIGLVKNQ